MLRLPKIAFSIGVIAGSFAIITPAVAAQPSGAKLVPFHATYAGSFAVEFTPLNRIITGTGGSGNATHLGRFGLTDTITVSLVPAAVPDCPVLGTNETFTGTLTAANGDTITLAGPGTGCPTSPTTVASQDALTVTGGTGRFEGASGSISLHTAVDRASHTEVITFDGTLSTPGSIK